MSVVETWKRRPDGRTAAAVHRRPARSGIAGDVQASVRSRWRPARASLGAGRIAAASGSAAEVAVRGGLDRRQFGRVGGGGRGERHLLRDGGIAGIMARDQGGKTHGFPAEPGIVFPVYGVFAAVRGYEEWQAISSSDPGRVIGWGLRGVGGRRRSCWRT